MKASWIHMKRGVTSRQARVGTVGTHHEELFGRGGFFGPTAMINHRKSPAEVIRIEGEVRPRVVKVTEAPTPDHGDARGEPLTMLTNSTLELGVSRRRAAMPYCYRNAVGDLLYFVHAGRGVFATEFGPLAYEPGDYILFPRGVTFRHMPHDEDGLFYVIQSTLPIRFTEHQQVGRHMPFDPALVETPDVAVYDWPEQAEWELRVKHHRGFTSVFLENNPVDVIGWKGDLFPLKLNIRDIIPISSDRIHVAPSGWSTFETDACMIVTFLPQTAVQDMTAEELPSNHRNIDCDEAVFLHSDHNHPGGLLLHMPQAIMHGRPQAARDAANAARKPGDRRMMTGVSVDAYEPLDPTEAYLELARAAGGAQ